MLIENFERPKRMVIDISNTKKKGIKVSRAQKNFQ